MVEVPQCARGEDQDDMDRDKGQEIQYYREMHPADRLDGEQLACLLRPHTGIRKPVAAASGVVTEQASCCKMS